MKDTDFGGEGHDRAYHWGRADERDDIVRWLRAQVSQAVSAGDLDLDWAANAIERGKHRRKEDK
jgi:hypothetical protein